MNNPLIGIGVFGTFGKPYGFEQCFYYDVVFNKTLDLNSNAIKIYPHTELFSVKREVRNGMFAICFSIYTYAKELDSNRGGTFIGSSIVLNDAYVVSGDVYKLLRELHDNTICNKKNILDDVIQVNQATQLLVRPLSDLGRVRSKIQNIKSTNFYNFNVNINKQIFVFSQNKSLIEIQIVDFFENSLKYYTDTDTLYFTIHKEILEYVEEKKLLKVISWEEFFLYRQYVLLEKESFWRHKSHSQKIIEKQNGIDDEQRDLNLFAANADNLINESGLADKKSELDFLYCLIQEIKERIQLVESESYSHCEYLKAKNNLFTDFRLLNIKKIFICVGSVIIIACLLFVFAFLQKNQLSSGNTKSTEELTSNSENYEYINLNNFFKDIPPDSLLTDMDHFNRLLAEYVIKNQKEQILEFFKKANKDELQEIKNYFIRLNRPVASKDSLEIMLSKIKISKINK